MAVQDPNHYVNNKVFLKAMKEHRKNIRLAKKNNLPIPPVSEYIGECLIKIAQRLSNRPNFMNYPFKEEMISDGIENCLMYINNFNPTKSKNPFAYFTQIVFFAFVRRIQKEKKQLATKYKAIQNAQVNDFFENPGNENLSAPQKYGTVESDLYMREFVDAFEKNKEKKKKLAKKKAETNNLDKFIS